MLGLHVLNAGHGESIVLELPENRWGVVDCYAANPDFAEANPTIAFLEQHGVQELEFLCLTHPHDDHYRGMAGLLERFPVREFWRSDAMTPPDLYGRCLDAMGLRDNDRYGQQNATDYWKLLDRVKQRRLRGELVPRGVSDLTSLYPAQVSLEPRHDSTGVTIWAIAPSRNQVEKYQDELQRCFDNQGQVVFTRVQANANNVSVVLLVRYGATRLLLGGDLEREGWLDVLERLKEPEQELAVTGVKVSHHGSATGYSEGLWAVFSRSGKPISVITPYRKFRLPRPAGVDEISRHSHRVFTTCGPAVQGEGQQFAFWPGFPKESELLIRTRFGAFRERGGPLGVVSLFFDNEGRCVHQNCSGSAVVMYDADAPGSEF